MTKTTEKPAPSSGGKVKGGSKKRYLAQCTASIGANKARRIARASKQKVADQTRQLTMRVPRGTARRLRREKQRAAQVAA